MSFPQTRLTLVQRLASGGSEEDWRHFLGSYWGPVCRFSLRFGAGSLADAEEIASQTFEILLANQLLTRWASHHTAKLRSLLCSVVRNILSNRNRIREGRDCLMPGILEHFRRHNDARSESSDAFYVAWVEDLLQQAMEAMALEYHSQGKGDYIRVLYARVCKQRSSVEVAEALELSPRTADRYYQEARDRLGHMLREILRGQIRNHCLAEEEDDEFSVEWRKLGQFLVDHGGLEAAIRQAYDLFDPVQHKRSTESALRRTTERLTRVLKR